MYNFGRSLDTRETANRLLALCMHCARRGQGVQVRGWAPSARSPSTHSATSIERGKADDEETHAPPVTLRTPSRVAATDTDSPTSFPPSPPFFTRESVPGRGEDTTVSTSPELCVAFFGFRNWRHVQVIRWYIHWLRDPPDRTTIYTVMEDLYSRGNYVGVRQILAAIRENW